MHPILNFGFFETSAYSFFTIVAFAVVICGSYWFALKRGFKKSDSLIMLLGMGLSTFIGARIFNVFVNFDAYVKDPIKVVVIDFEGFSLYGGALFAVITGIVISYKRKMEIYKFADTVIPFLGIGIALMRMGCFLNGCCFGRETNLPWGVKFPFLSPAHVEQLSTNILTGTSVHAVHPTQIYELIAAIIGSVAAFILIGKKKPAGTAFFIFVIWFTAFRWFNMQFRVLPYSEVVLNVGYPLFYLVIIGICSRLLFKICVKREGA